MPLHFFEILAVGLAAARIAQFLVFDSITQPARDQLENWYADKPVSKIRHWLLIGVNCPLCVGFWASGGSLALYVTLADRWHVAPLLTFGLLWWAVAMVQCLANAALDKLSE